MTSYVALIVALTSIMMTIVSVTLFIGRIKWTSEKLEKDIALAKEDINKLGKKVSDIRDAQKDEIKEILNRIASVDRAVAEINVSIKYLSEMIKAKGKNGYDKAATK